VTARRSDVPLELLEDNERTLLAWLRTSVTLLALGCVIAQLGVYVERELSVRGLVGVYSASLAILLVATVAVVLGIDDYHHRRAVLERRGVATSLEDLRARSLYPFAMAVGFIGCCLLIILVVMP
jgi:uncharacterized membrane protein YidH (DUF202 family)